jgi:hypothetical protein
MTADRGTELLAHHPGAGPIAETVVYLRRPGTVVCCRNCSAMLMVTSQIRDANCVDLRGLTAHDPRHGG